MSKRRPSPLDPPIPLTDEQFTAIVNRLADLIMTEFNKEVEVAVGTSAVEDSPGRATS